MEWSTRSSCRPLEGALFPEEPGFHHRLAVMDPHSRLVLSPQLDIHVLELRKLERFSDAKRDLARYQSRVDYLHVQATLEVEREEDAARLAELEAALMQVQAEKEFERAETERVLAQKERERTETERFRRLLLAAGIDPDSSSN